MRCHVAFAKKVILATAILLNIAILWNDPEFEDDDHHEDDQEEYVVIEDNSSNEAVRVAGQNLRNELCNAMPRRQHTGCP
jgi:hypothetical protein